MHLNNTNKIVAATAKEHAFKEYCRSVLSDYDQEVLSNRLTNYLQLEEPTSSFGFRTRPIQSVVSCDQAELDYYLIQNFILHCHLDNTRMDRFHYHRIKDTVYTKELYKLLLTGNFNIVMNKVLHGDTSKENPFTALLVDIYLADLNVSETERFSHLEELSSSKQDEVIELIEGLRHYQNPEEIQSAKENINVFVYQA